MTAAELMAAIIGPAMGPSCWAVLIAVTTPESISIVAPAMRIFFAAFSCSSLASLSPSIMSAMLPITEDTPFA